MGTDAARCGRAARRAVPLLLLWGCSAPAPAPKASTAAPAARGLARYLPLEDGTVFSYATTIEPSGERGLLVLEIRRPRPELAELVVAGRAQRLSVTAGAVAHVAGGFLLREPVAAGSTFRGDFGLVRVTGIDQTVTVPAGTFAGCIETVEEATSNEGFKRTKTAFCPGVGITLRETDAEQEGTHATERIALKSWGKRFDPAKM